MSDKLTGRHLERKAILYIRQSSTHQVLHNEESRRLQYGMEQRLRDLGWKEVEVIDDDLGRSASGSAKRDGFERMVAEACLARLERFALVKSRASRVTVATGISSWRCAASSMPFSSIMKRSTTRETATTVCCSVGRAV